MYTQTCNSLDFTKHSCAALQNCNTVTHIKTFDTAVKCLFTQYNMIVLGMKKVFHLCVFHIPVQRETTFGEGYTDI